MNENCGHVFVVGEDAYLIPFPKGETLEGHTMDADNFCDECETFHDDIVICAGCMQRLTVQ